MVYKQQSFGFGMLSDELRGLEVCVRENPNRADARLKYARMLGIAGRLEDSREEYHHLLSRISPQHELYETARNGYVQKVCETTTRSSRKRWNRPQALRLALRWNTKLHSLTEAVAARLGNLENSQEYQVVSTLALYHRDINNDIVVGFAEIPTSKEGLALMQQGFDAYYSDSLGFRELVMPAQQGLVAELLEQARCEGRVVSVLENNMLDMLVLSTALEDGISAYASHPFVQALFGGSAFAEMNAEYLRQRNHTQSCVWYVSRNHLEEQLTVDNVLVRPVGLGGVDGVILVCADNYFIGSGRSRGVAHVGKKKIHEK